MKSKLLHYVVELEDGSNHDVQIDPNDSDVLIVDGVTRNLKVNDGNTGLVVATEEGKRVPLRLCYEQGDLVAITPDGARQRVRVHLAETHQFRANVLKQPPPPPIEHSGRLTAPIAGNVIALSVAHGADVRIGDAVLILEAMKMQNTISSPVAGSVSYAVKVGQTVRAGDLLATIVAKGSN
jgi:biotin carboxyl carrier protein